MKLTVYAIVRDEEKSLSVMLDSVKGIADEIVIVDTGSTDKTIEVAKKYTDRVYVHPKAEQWRVWPVAFNFAEARNYALDLIKDADWILSIDCDEIFEGGEGLKAYLETVPENIDLVLSTIEMCKDDGRPYQRFLGERIFRCRPDIRFDGAMHNWVNVVPEKRQIALQFKLIHNRGMKSEASRLARAKQRIEMVNYHLLPKAAATPPDRRYLFYVAGTYFDNGMLAEAIPFFERYLENSEWDAERFQAAILLGQAYLETGQLDKAKATVSRRLIDNWRRAECFVILAQVAMGAGEWQEAEHWAKIASLIPEPVDPMFVDVEAHSWKPHYMLWQIYQMLQDNQKAQEHGKMAIELGCPLVAEIARWEKNHLDYDEKRILVLVDRGQTCFIAPLIEAWKKQGKEVRTKTEVSADDEDVKWAHVIWCEWAGPLAIELTKLPKTCRIVVRVHGYETHADLLPQIDWAKIDDVIFTADYLREIALQQVPRLAEWCNLYTVGGGVETDKYSIAGNEGPKVDGRILYADDPRIDGEKDKEVITDENGKEWWSRPYEYKWLLNQVKPTDDVLDLGCGESRFVDLLKTQCKTVTLQDVDPEAKIVQRTRHPDVPFILGNDYGHGEFDAITCCSVLEHLENDEIQKLCRNAYMALKAGGRFAMTFDSPRVDLATMHDVLVSEGFSVGNLLQPPGLTAEEMIRTVRITIYAVVAYKPRQANDRKKIAMACYGNTKKNFPLAFQILAALPEEYQLHIATEWQDHRLKMYCEHIVHEMGLGQRVFWYPWQTDLNEFYKGKDFYLSASIEESFHYSLAEAMAAGLKPVIHGWKSAHDWYDGKWIFRTVAEAVEMILAERKPQEYRDYAIEHLDIKKNVERIGRILSKPTVSVLGNPTQPYAVEHRIKQALERLGCDTQHPQPQAVLMTGHQPDLTQCLAGAKKILWYGEQVVGDNEHAELARQRIAPIVPQVDMVVYHNPAAETILRDMGANLVACVPMLFADAPFRCTGEAKQYDIGFCGVINDRRKAFIEELAKEFNIETLSNYDHEQVNAFYNRCKVILNMHFTDALNIETRIGEAMAAGACVFTEALPDGHGIPDGTFVTGTTETLRELLEDEPLRKVISQKAYQWIWSKQTLEHQLEKILRVAGL